MRRRGGLVLRFVVAVVVIGLAFFGLTTLLRELAGVSP